MFYSQRLQEVLERCLAHAHEMKNVWIFLSLGRKECFLTLLAPPGPYTTNLAEHTQALLEKPWSTEPQLAIRVQQYHDARLGFV